MTISLVELLPEARVQVFTRIVYRFNDKIFLPISTDQVLQISIGIDPFKKNLVCFSIIKVVDKDTMVSNITKCISN